MERLALEGFSLCRRLLEELAQGKAEEARDTQRCLCQCNRSLSQKLYEANRAALGRELPQNRFCGCVACFQMMGYLAGQALSGRPEEGKAQLARMKELLEEFEGAHQRGEAVSVFFMMIPVYENTAGRVA
ncbi:MAG: hypothetical protein HFI42_11825 [Lachnospiraceae bacterium]|nr:hypothetical protein [Lachnospiraceae bacterium]